MPPLADCVYELIDGHVVAPSGAHIDALEQVCVCVCVCVCVVCACVLVYARVGVCPCVASGVCVRCLLYTSPSPRD